MNPIVRNRLLELFEKHRATPGADFDENHFLDYLVASPAGRGAFRESFRGLRRYNAYLDEVQGDFAIHFSQGDREKNFTLEEFAERVEQLELSPQSSLSSLACSEKAGAGWATIILLDFFLGCAALALREFPWLTVSLATAMIGVTGWYARFAIGYRAYLKSLRQKILAKRAARAPSDPSRKARRPDGPRP
ncbi:MAG: hypothetical protein ACOY33_11325 [Pseudomonadota bacterium]